MRARLLNGVVWQGSLRWIAQILSWASTLTVARHLSVEAYGIVSVSVVIVAMTGYVTESGIGRTIVLRNVTAPKILSQLHSVATVIGLTFAVLMILLAAPAARFFRNDHIAAPLMVWSIALVISGAITVPSALLQQRLDFRQVAIIELLRSVSQALVVLVLAISGASYWALVAGFLVASLVGFIGYTRSAWLPFARPRPSEVLPHLRYARHVITGNLAWYAYSNSDFLVIGRMLSVGVLGVYQFAWNIAQLPGEKLTNVVQAAIAPLLGALEDQPAEMRDLLARATSLISLVVFPVIAGIAVIAPLIIAPLFGERWLAAVPSMRVLLAFGAIQSVTVCLTTGLNARGLAHVTSRMSILLAAGSTVGFLAVVTTAGITGVAVVHLILQPIVTLYVIRKAEQAFGLRFADVITAVKPACTATAALIVTCSMLLRLMPSSAPFSSAAVIAITGCIIYVGVLMSFYRADVLGLIQSFRGDSAKA